MDEGDMQAHASDTPSSRHSRIQTGLQHAGIDTVKVIVKHRGHQAWFAQGLEIDYTVGGGSLEEATAEFARSLGLMIDDHLRAHGHIGHIVRPAPPEVWSAFFDGVWKDRFEVKSDLVLDQAIPARIYVERAA